MNKRLWLSSLLGLIAFLIFIPRAIMYPDLKFLSWFIFLLIFGLLPFIVFKTIGVFRPNTPWRIIGAFLSILIIGPSFGFYQKYREVKELENKGLWIKCVVIEEKYSGGSKGNKGWLIKCIYKCDDSVYETNFKKDESNKYSIGDTLNLIYSKDFPKIYRLENEWKHK